MKKMLLIVLTIGVILALTVTALSAEATRNNAAISAGDYYGRYYDEAKVNTAVKTTTIDAEEKTLSYVRTENLKEKSVDSRADKYGTYDVYVDQAQTEYLYLLNSDILCGFKMKVVGEATAKEDAIEEAKAMSIADDFLKRIRSNAQEYKFLSCEYDELAGYYDIQYYLPVGGYKTDDIFRLWVNAQGEITSFSEFNHKRYDDLNVSAVGYKKAGNALESNIKTSIGTAGDIKYSVVDSYISVDDNGEVILVEVIELRIPCGENYMVQREVRTQPIT